MNKILFSLLLIIIITVFGFFGYFYYQRKNIEKLEIQLYNLMKTQTPIKFKILKKTEDSLYIKVKYYNLEELEIVEKNYTIKGNELAFDFYVFNRNEKHFAFPYLIFSDQVAPSDGIDIANDYNSNGFPEIFDFKEIDRQKFEYLSEKYNQILRKNLTFGEDFGNSVHDIKEFKQFDIGVVYKISVHSKGGIEIIVND